MDRFQIANRVHRLNAHTRYSRLLFNNCLEIAVGLALMVTATLSALSPALAREGAKQMVAPVTKSDARDAKYTAVPAHSSGLSQRPTGVRAIAVSYYTRIALTGFSSSGVSAIVAAHMPSGILSLSIQRALDGVTQMTRARFNGRFPDSFKSEIFDHQMARSISGLNYIDRWGKLERIS